MSQRDEYFQTELNRKPKRSPEHTAAVNEILSGGMSEDTDHVFKAFVLLTDVLVQLGGAGATSGTFAERSLRLRIEKLLKQVGVPAPKADTRLTEED